MSQTADRVDAENASRPDAPTTHPEFDRLLPLGPRADAPLDYQEHGRGGLRGR